MHLVLELIVCYDGSARSAGSLRSRAPSRSASGPTSPFASIRGDEGQNIYVGDESSVQNSMVIHGLETFEGGHELIENEVEVASRKYSGSVGKRIPQTHQSQAHGPAKVGDDAFIGIQALIFKTEVGTLS